MRRRAFLSTVAAAAVLGRVVRAVDPPRDLRVTRVTGFDVTSQRSKLAGRNAFKDVHGDSTRDALLKIETNQGLVGFGVCRANEMDAGKLLKQDPFASFWSEPIGFASSPLGRGTGPLWDLLGKAAKQPIYQLLGAKGPVKTPVYDGSIYFLDLLPQYAAKWEDRAREEIDMGLKIGHRAFKVKIGRGFKWMPRKEGDARDIAMLKTLREHAGPDILIGIDANNGYDLAGAKRLFDEIGSLNIAFAEEMFPEVVEQCLEFKAHLRASGLKTLVADGETQDDPEVFRPFVEAGAIEVYQGDMNRFGIEGILAEAALAGTKGFQVAPHNWGSYMGYFTQLHMGRGIDNFYRAEHDPLTNSILVPDGFAIREGVATLPDRPGLGLVLDDKQLQAHAAIRFDRAA